jgi:hypothetical protein
MLPEFQFALKRIDEWGDYHSPNICQAVTHGSATRDAIANLVTNAIDAGTPPGTLQFQTSGDVQVATLTFSNDSFGAASSAVCTAAAITSDTSATGGTIAKARLKNAAGTDVVICSVTATGGGGDITLSSVVISAGQTVAVTSLTYTAPP